MTIATCETLGQGLGDWLNTASQAEVDNFCQILHSKCGEAGAFVIGDGQTIKITGDGTAANPYRLEVMVDPDPENALAAGTSGLMVPNASLKVDAATGDVTFTDNLGASEVVFNLSEVLNTVEHENTNTVKLEGLGDASSPLKADVILDPDVDNVIVATPNGLLTKNAHADWDAATNVLTFTDNKGVVKTLDLSQFLVDIHIQNAEFDPQTLILTLHSNDPNNPVITVDLGELSKSTTQDTVTVKITGNGSAGDPLTAEVQVSADTDNRITIESDGLKVAPEIPPAPTTDGTYALVVEVSGGNETLTWEKLGC